MSEERGDQPFPEFGVLMLIPIEINSNCDFQGVGGVVGWAPVPSRSAHEYDICSLNINIDAPG